MFGANALDPHKYRNLYSSLIGPPSALALLRLADALWRALCLGGLGPRFGQRLGHSLFGVRSILGVLASRLQDGPEMQWSRGIRVTNMLIH